MSPATAGTYAVNITAFGAKCDGSTDDTGALNAAIANVTGNFTNTSGGIVQLPSGVCRIDGPVSLQDVAQIGAEVPHFSDAPASGIVEAGTVVSVGSVTGATGYNNSVGSIQASNLTITGYRTGRGDPIKDHNTLSLNGFSADGVAGPLLSATVTTGDIGMVNLTGVNVRGYCAGGPTNAVDLSTPLTSTQSTAVIIVGSTIVTGRSGCGGVSGSTGGAPYVNANNIVGVFPLN